MIRRELAADVDAVRRVTTAAFARPATPDKPPPEADLIDALRASEAWLPALSMVAVDPAGEVIGHVLGTRGQVAAAPVVALGPIAVRPDQQRLGFGHALMHALLGAADVLDEPLVAVLGEPVYYARFGFRLAEEFGIAPPMPQWRTHFQVRTLTAYHPALRGTFAYAEPFYQL